MAQSPDLHRGRATQVKDLPLPNRPRRWLQAAGIRTVDDLLQRTEEDLLTIDNFGQTSLGHVKRFLRRHNLSLHPPRKAVLDAGAIRAALRDRGCRLAKREREVLRMRYGLSNGRAVTLKEAGRHFRLTRERVRQIQKQAEQKVAARAASRRA